MKKDKQPAVPKTIKGGPGSNPENKFKKGSKGVTLAAFNSIVTGAVESVEARSGGGLANKGTNIAYDEKR